MECCALRHALLPRGLQCVQLLGAAHSDAVSLLTLAPMLWQARTRMHLLNL